MQSYYSYYGSRLHLILEDEIADGFNRFLKSFYQAQSRHNEVHGQRWDPDNEALSIRTNDKDKAAYDAVGEVIKLLVKINGGGLDIPEEELTSDYLVKLD